MIGGHLSREETTHKIEHLEDEELIRLLDSKSRSIGDTAWTVLARNHKLDLVVDRILDGTIHTKLGKIRATNLLCDSGKQFKRSEKAWLALLADKNPDVVGNALFGLVFLQDKANLPAIAAEANRRGSNDRAYKALVAAMDAIEKGNPFMYSRYFKDAQGVWELDPVRFPDGAAPASETP